MLVVKAGRADDVETGARRRLAHQVHVASDVVRTWIQRAGIAGRLKLLKAVDADRQFLAAIDLRRGIEQPPAEADGEMLMLLPRLSMLI